MVQLLRENSSMFCTYHGTKWACVQTPVAIGRRALRTGLQDLKDTLKDWVPWYDSTIDQIVSDTVARPTFNL